MAIRRQAFRYDELEFALAFAPTERPFPANPAIGSALVNNTERSNSYIAPSKVAYSFWNFFNSFGRPVGLVVQSNRTASLVRRPLRFSFET